MRRRLILALAALAASCEARRAPCAVSPRREAHACLHAQQGPFASVDGTARPPSLLAETHTLYTVHLSPADAPRPAGQAGQVRFEAPRDGCWAFFSTHPVELHAGRHDTERLPWQHTQAVSACPELSTAFTIALRRGEDATLTVRPQRAKDGVGLLVEHTGEVPWDQPAAQEQEPDAALSTPDAPGAASAESSDASPDVVAAAGFDSNADVPEVDAGSDADGSMLADSNAPMCHTSGPCTRNDECCDYCHDGDHCH